jgi:CRP-like cAMP-binding protein
MSRSKLTKLKQRASLALRTGDLGAALEHYRSLEQLEPQSPIWPERQALVHDQLGQTAELIDALLRAVEAYAEAGEVIRAIASCKQILDLEPDNPAARDCLELLYMPQSGTNATGATPESRGSSPPDPAGDVSRNPAGPQPDDDAPLNELLLTQAIPGAQPMHLVDPENDGIHEIPIDNDASGVLDLRLDELTAETAHAGMPLADSPAESARSAREHLSQTPLFGSLAPASLNRLVKQARIIQLSEAEVLFREGDPPTSLYVVIEGAVIPIAEGETRTRLSVLEDGAFFGEIGIVTNQPRTATIEAIVPTRLLAIDRSVIWGLIREEPEVFKVLLRFLRERLIDRQIQTSPFFTAFVRAERSAVARQFRFLEIRSGATLIEQGRPSDGLFVLLCGSLDVVDSDSHKILTELHCGDLFGGVSLLAREPARASVVASEKVWVLLMPEEKFRRICEVNPGLEELISELARERDVLLAAAGTDADPPSEPII